jgi:parvulin-like peptidyl-prolyl isomerase
MNPSGRHRFMGKSWGLCVLLGALAWGQAAPSAPPAAQAPAAPPDTSASVPPTAAVITINGVCSPQPKPVAAKTGTAATSATAAKASKAPAESTKPAECKTVITKEQFEKMAGALSPNVTPQLKHQLAGALPRLMAMSTQAKKDGIDKTDQYKEALKFVQMQVLANELQRRIQTESSNISDEDVEKYYNEHKADFEQYNVDRIFVPRTKQGETATAMLQDEGKKPTEEEKKAKQEEAEQAMTKLAEDLRGRAVAGEDFTKLQKEAFDAAGMKIESPTINLPNIRRNGLPAAHAAAFDLKPGDVSQVISDSGGHYIYKLNSKTDIPVEQAKTEIHQRLQSDRMRDAMEQLNNSFKVEENEAYFGPAGPMPPQPGMRSMPVRPGSGAPGNAGPKPQSQTPPPAPPAGANQH